MAKNVFETGKVIVEINILNPEKFLNILWKNNINILNIKRVDVVTLRLKISYDDYFFVSKKVKEMKGKINIIESSGIIFFLGRLKSKMFLTLGGGIFVILLLYFSTFVWSIEINTKNNVSPYEIRQQLYSLGIYPGISKSKIDYKNIEKEIENLNSDILWIRARVQGSTLRITIEEKVNPPNISEGKYGNLTSKMEGQVKRVYAFSGRSAVHIGDYVKAGEVLIEGINGKEEEPYNVIPNGVVMANTFYEKNMVMKINGTELKRTGEKDSDIYIKIFDKKIYIKKAIKDFKECDKIEESGKIITKVKYYEKKEEPITNSKEELIEEAKIELENSVYNILTREAKIVDRIVTVKDISEKEILVNVIFVVEQNILNNEPIDY